MEPYTQWGLPPGAKARLGKGAIGRIRYSPDGAQLAVTGPLGIWLYDVHTCTEVALLKSDQIDETTQLPLSWTGTTLVNLNWDDTISLWDIDTGNQLALLSGHTNWVGTVAFSPDGYTLASASADGTVRLWNATTGHSLTVLKGHTSVVFTVAFSPDSRILVSYVVAFSPDGWTLASAGQDGKIRLWDPINGNLIAVMSGHIDDVDGLAFSLLMVKPLPVQVTAPSFCGTLKLSETHIVKTHFN